MIEKIRSTLFRLFKPDSFIGKIIDKLVTREIISYLFFGVLTTLVSWVSYAVFIRIIPDSVNSFTSSIPESVAESFKIFICSVLSWIISVLFAFVTNKLFVFESRDRSAAVVARELLSFTGSRIITGVIEWFGTPLLVSIGLNRVIFGTEGLLAKIIVSVIVVILNYVFSKIIVFRRKKENEPSQDTVPGRENTDQ